MVFFPLILHMDGEHFILPALGTILAFGTGLANADKMRLHHRRQVIKVFDHGLFTNAVQRTKGDLALFPGIINNIKTANS